MSNAAYKRVCGLKLEQNFHIYQNKPNLLYYDFVTEPFSIQDK